MRLRIIFVLVMILACQGNKQDSGKTKTASKESEAVAEADNIVCSAEVCLQLRNHDTSNKSFEIYMINAIPVAGFQCDFPGIGISDVDGGLLKENGFEASNSDSRVLAFSIQGKVISTGMGVLTEISYSESTNEVCMTEIIFAGIGGVKLSNDTPECLKLN